MSVLLCIQKFPQWCLFDYLIILSGFHGTVMQFLVCSGLFLHSYLLALNKRVFMILFILDNAQVTYYLSVLLLKDINIMVRQFNT